MSRPDNNLEISGKRNEYSANAECESLKKPRRKIQEWPKKVTFQLCLRFMIVKKYADNSKGGVPALMVKSVVTFILETKVNPGRALQQ
ncbi:hypothetical protein RDI58_008946 [Solanum bulbocastanum]|uniref:Uncharacterized protein n=1 Tax=Solanum bulbocastanum TaxID=147425 RepID=A0AAN8YNM8_SOLBU